MRRKNIRESFFANVLINQRLFKSNQLLGAENYVSLQPLFIWGSLPDLLSDRSACGFTFHRWMLDEQQVFDVNLVIFSPDRDEQPTTILQLGSFSQDLSSGGAQVEPHGPFYLFAVQDDLGDEITFLRIDRSERFPAFPIPSVPAVVLAPIMEHAGYGELIADELMHTLPCGCEVSDCRGDLCIRWGMVLVYEISDGHIKDGWF
jgi:hypothetical protein